MKKMAIDGYSFEGPYVLEKDELPASAGIALMCTEAGEGVKILSVEESEDLRSHILGSDRISLWKENAYHGIVDIYIYLTDIPEDKRKKITDTIVSKRSASLVCQPKEIIEDDW